MKKLFTKILPLSMAIIMAFGSIIPVFATVNEKQTVNTGSTLQTEVVYNQESTFSVILPKLIDLGTDKTTDYTVTVTGDLSSDETIFVVPDDSFYMKDKNTSNPKDDVEAIVTQNKTEWKFNELETIGNGNVTAENLTAGTWEGKFYFNIKLENCNISVTAKDEEGNDLNASATYITGSEKDNLLNSLVDEGYVNDTSEVDALINVKSDDFDGLADTTFDVSDTFEEGDEIIILHFNEETSEWEYIGQETVDENGLISGDFTSYSPVVFVKVTENGEYVPTELEPGLYDTEGNMLCNWDELVNIYGLKITKNFTITSSKTNTGSLYYICNNNENLSSAKKIVISNTVTELGEYVFAYSNLVSIIIPNSVTEIGKGAFYSCKKLTSITIPDSVTTMGQQAFHYCSSLKFVQIGNSITEIEGSTFAECNGLEHIIIPEGVVVIEDFAFKNCYNLISLTIPNSVTTLGDWTFAYCSKLTSLNIGNGLKSTGRYVFSYLNINTITFNGTIEQWNNISKWDDWNYASPIKTIICLNGEISL